MSILMGLYGNMWMQLIRNEKEVFLIIDLRFVLIVCRSLLVVPKRCHQRLNRSAQILLFLCRHQRIEAQCLFWLGKKQQVVKHSSR